MYVAVVTSLSFIPLLKARAFRVVVELNVRAELYTELEVVGSAPSVV